MPVNPSHRKPHTDTPLTPLCEMSVPSDDILCWFLGPRTECLVCLAGPCSPTVGDSQCVTARPATRSACR